MGAFVPESSRGSRVVKVTNSLASSNRRVWIPRFGDHWCRGNYMNVKSIDAKSPLVGLVWKFVEVQRFRDAGSMADKKRSGRAFIVETKVAYRFTEKSNEMTVRLHKHHYRIHILAEQC
ncbi:hypothetical protein TNCV_2215691 [Trichonephila clavipes]|nr:hypothetical protein TNCV_2215691 [Trichonephila clavipes]